MRFDSIHDAPLTVEPTGQGGGHCDCCGHETRIVWGNICADAVMVATYFVHWTRGRQPHFCNLDLLVGTWRERVEQGQTLSSWIYNSAREQFMAIDSTTRPAAESNLCTRALTRDQVLADPELMADLRALLDAVWSGDPRIAEVRTASAND